ncbi:MAG: ClC family H(+)/Cl(-) exchange transporter [Spirochaetales bacterium]|jgi:H+/Cl- antiporter ClcA
MNFLSAMWNRVKDQPKVHIYLGSSAVGIISGLVIVAYRAIITFFEASREDYLKSITGSMFGFVIWFSIAIAAGIVTAMLTRRKPLIKGSGIPQVKAFLLRRITFDWKRELPFKFIGGSLALGAGLSLGREGPSIQLGSLVGNAMDDLTGKHDYTRYFVTAGAAAGISAAFNAPLAGVLFCLEELHRNFSPIMLTSTLIGSFFANAVMWIFFGNSAVFGIHLTQLLPLELYFSAVLPIGVVCGLLGSVFNHGLLEFQKTFKRLLPNETHRILSAFAVAAIISLIFSPITGGGNKLIETIVQPGNALGIIALLLAGKFVFTLFSYASGAPGGIFLPMLAIGALIGALAQMLLPVFGIEGNYLANYILLGMAAFFVAVVRAPITGAVLITEMAGSLGHFPAFILVSVIATLMAGLVGSKPIYDSLLEQIKPASEHKKDSFPITLHFPLTEGCQVNSCADVIAALPEGCILSAIVRGDEKLFPEPSEEVYPGDELQVLVRKDQAPALKERILEIGRASPGSIEA